jgi:two-component system, chemotaxis family, sensor kinase CheA
VQSQENTYDYIAIACAVLLTLIVVGILWSSYARFANAQHAQLDNLIRATTAFGEGDLTMRVRMGEDSEFNEVGQTFNRMAGTLQSQRTALYDRDIFGQVLQLNTVLTESLDLSTLVHAFFRKITNVLDGQIAALFLYDAGREKLVLYASHGLELQDKKTEFALGEGLIGHVGEGNEPLLVSSQEQATSEFPVKTIMGVVMPSSLYHLPLRQGNELLGVMVIGSVFPMSEKTQNILQVTGSMIASSIRNARTYEHVQAQAQELTAYAHQQEESNQALRSQRDELTVLNAALEEANRVRSQFLSTMSHELRTPLASIIGFSQILQRSANKYPLNERQISNVDRILKNAQHLLSLINDVLDLSKIEAGHMDVNTTEVSVGELITNVVDEVQSIAVERKLELKIDVADDIPTIETDPRKVHQILLNLISNALKFTEKGSVSVVATRQKRATSEKEEGEQVAISVQDTGIGIEADKQAHIFEAFYQVDSSNSRTYGGTGLGLSIVYELTTLLGGRIEFQSQEGQGSTFTVLLPLRLREQRQAQNLRLRTLQSVEDEKNIVPMGLGGITSPQPAVVLKDAETSDHAPKTLLSKQTPVPESENLVVAIDDNPDVLQLIAASLEQSPYQVVGVQDPTQAVAVVKELHPKAITLDVMMPQINGWQILHRLKSNPATSTIPVVLLTVLEDRSAGHVLGADEYLVKPVGRDTLLSTLRQVMSQSTKNKQADTEPDSTTRQDKAVSAESSVSASDESEKSVLLAPDEPEMYAMVEHLVQENGYTVYRTHDEQELMHLVGQEHPDFLMILMNKNGERTEEGKQDPVAPATPSEQRVQGNTNEQAGQ